jgi:electron transfer flavoprotein beta subunit
VVAFNSLFRIGCFQILHALQIERKAVRILVCLKQVPEKNSHYRLKNDSSGIEEQDLAYETNECDLYALEEALLLRECHGGEVVVLSAGDDRVQKTIKHGLAMGADRAIHLKCTNAEAGDTHVTAKLIARAIRNESLDMILAGVQSEDLGFAQTGPLIAFFLGWPHATIVVEIEVNDHQTAVLVKRELESGLFERLEMPLPAVLSIQSGIRQPRYPTLKGIMQAKKKGLISVRPEDLGFRSDEVGWQGSKVIPCRLSLPEKKKRTVLLEGSEQEMAQVLIEKLQREAKVL